MPVRINKSTEWVCKTMFDITLQFFFKTILFCEIKDILKLFEKVIYLAKMYLKKISLENVHLYM